MTKDIAQAFKNALQPFAGVDNIISVLSGITRVFEYKGTDNVVKKFPYPLDCNQPEPNCEECDELYILVPDQKKRCIVYFEGGVSTPLQSLIGATKFQTKLSLICWYNMQGFSETANLQSRLISLFSDKIKKTRMADLASEGISNFYIEVMSVTDSDPTIFSKYTYDQQKSQYLCCPFSSFKIDFKVQFISHENSICFEPILAIAIPNCC